jgi:hypothetical protein
MRVPEGEQSEETGVLVRAENSDAWTRIKSLVLDSVTSPHSKRAYEQALDAFERWCVETGATGFTKATVQGYRAALETAGLAASSINVRLSAIRKLAAEAADNALLAPGGGGGRLARPGSQAPRRKGGELVDARSGRTAARST